MKNRRKGSGDNGCLGFILGVAAIVFSTITLTLKANDDAWEVTLVKQGHAVYYLDKDYIKKFRILSKEEMCSVESPTIPPKLQ